MSDAKVLVHNDVLLRESDVGTLHNRGWLNDQIINFYFQFLEAKRGPENGHKFVDPAFSFLLLNAGEEDIAGLLECAQFSNSNAVFFAVSDNTDAGVAYGGSHWSLLLWLPPQMTFHHYDSCKGSQNNLAARKLATILAQSGTLQETLEFVTEKTPQQANMYDCGLYVLAGAHIISFELICGETLEEAAEALGSTAKPKTVLSFREWLIELIISLATEQDLAMQGIKQRGRLRDCPLSTCESLHRCRS